MVLVVVLKSFGTEPLVVVLVPTICSKTDQTGPRQHYRQDARNRPWNLRSLFAGRGTAPAKWGHVSVVGQDFFFNAIAERHSARRHVRRYVEDPAPCDNVLSVLA